MREPAHNADLEEIRHAVRQLTRGRSNATGTVTLAANAASTTVTANGVCGKTSVITYSPTTANASAEIKNGTIYVSAVNNNSFVITHANNAQTDRTFGWMIQG